jgi:hypothetical protein
MSPKNSSKKSYHYAPSEGFELRSRLRLQRDLGIDQAAAEAILHLRSQVMELQDQIRALEVELGAQHASQQIRLATYREIYEEATWIELEFQD